MPLTRNFVASTYSDFTGFLAAVPVSRRCQKFRVLLNRKACKMTRIKWLRAALLLPTFGRSEGSYSTGDKLPAIPLNEVQAWGQTGASVSRANSLKTKDFHR